MIKGLCQRMLAVASTFLRIEKGSILVYTGAFMAVGVGGAALSIDIGRIVLLRTQMQNRADAGALGGAAQLDAMTGAVERAKVVVKDSMKAWTTAAADSAELVVLTVEIYAAADDHISRGEITTVDNEARFVEVILEKRTLSFFYAPAVNILQGAGGDNQLELGARAVAMSDPFVCKAQPLMVCNPFDDGDPATHNDSLSDPWYGGKGIMLKAPPGNTMAPGNFGFLALPADDSFNGAGQSAVAVAKALSDEEPEVCFGLSTLATAPGVKIVPATRAINERFGMDWWDNTLAPAPNVMNYYYDYTYWTDPDAILGDGGWPNDEYWDSHHLYMNEDGTPVMILNPKYEADPSVDQYIPKIVPKPSPLNGASRFQMYLFEQGITYWKKNGKSIGKRSTVVEPEDTAGWTKVDPNDWPEAAVIPTNVKSHNNNLDGMPEPGQTVSSIGYERRVLRVAVMDCLAYEIQGADTYPATGQFVAIFLIRQANDVADGGTIYGEIIGPVEPKLSLEFHGNVRLVE